MTNSQELYKLLTETVIPEVEAVLKAMSEYLETNEATEAMQRDIDGLRAIHQNFLDIMIAIEESEIEEENCKQLIEEITMLRSMGNEAGVAEA